MPENEGNQEGRQAGNKAAPTRASLCACVAMAATCYIRMPSRSEQQSAARCTPHAAYCLGRHDTAVAASHRDAARAASIHACQPPRALSCVHRPYACMPPPPPQVPITIPFLRVSAQSLAYDLEDARRFLQNRLGQPIPAELVAFGWKDGGFDTYMHNSNPKSFRCAAGPGSRVQCM